MRVSVKTVKCKIGLQTVNYWIFSVIVAGAGDFFVQRIPGMWTIENGAGCKLWSGMRRSHRKQFISSGLWWKLGRNLRMQLWSKAWARGHLRQEIYFF